VTGRDYCGGCGQPLKEAPLGGRYACCPDAAMYWTPHAPFPEDLRGLHQMTGEKPRMQTACVNPAGEIVQHEPLFLYRSP
jgi:hypothetical protein